MENTTKEYIGEKEIKVVTDTTKLTPLGGKVMEVTYVDGTTEEITEKTLKIIKDTKPCDATELRRRRVEPVVQEFLIMMREGNLKLSEVDYAMSLVIESINQNSNEANNKLWNVSDGGERTFLQVDEVLKDGEKETKEK